MKVSNMQSNKGNKIPNQFIVEINGIRYFQSYSSIIAKIENGKITLDSTYWNYSKTTSKYRNIFLGLTTSQTEQKIIQDKIIFDNLNK